MHRKQVLGEVRFASKFLNITLNIIEHRSFCRSSFDNSPILKVAVEDLSFLVTVTTYGDYVS